MVINTKKDDGTWHWGIIDTDNFGGDYPDEKWVVPAIHRFDTVDKVADLLNKDLGENSRRCYRVQRRDYELQPGFEP